MTTILNSTSSQNSRSTQGYEIVFIDAALDNYNSLISGVRPGIDVIVLDTGTDGIEQISRVLDSRRSISALHLISHGVPGGLILGNSALTLETLPRYSLQILSWSKALTADADLLIYGCEVAQGAGHERLLYALSELTGANVAASNTKTGNGKSGGNWQLEVQLGKVTTALALQPETMASYQGVLGEPQLIDIDLGSGSGSPSGLTEFGGQLFVSATDGSSGLELFKINGTTATLVKDIRSGSLGSDPQELTVFGDKLYFTAVGDGGFGRELYVSTNLNSPIKDINAGGIGSDPTELQGFSGALYFSADNSTNGKEPWKSDGTFAGTNILQNINGFGNSDPRDFTEFQGKLYFSAFDGFSRWIYSTGGLNSQIASFACTEPAEFTVSGNNLYFSAQDAVNGRELWVTNGTTFIPLSINTGSDNGGNSNPTDLTVFNGKVYFSAFSNNTSGTELWMSDGTQGGTQLVKEIRQFGASNPRDLTVAGGKLYFIADDGEHGNELWVSDGTANGTKLVKDLHPGGPSSNPRELIEVNGKLYFSANDSQSGQELWVSDGTADGTKLVKDLNPNGDSNPSELTRVGNQLYFTANDGKNGQELWVLDTTSGPGTGPGTGTGTNNGKTLTGTAGDDVLSGDSGDDTLKGLAGNDKLKGQAGKDKLLGQAGNDTLLGGDGDDVLDGGAGNDKLKGQAGKDTLYGKQGKNVLFGNQDADIFVLHGKGLAKIQDFASGEDLIGLKNISFGQLDIFQKGSKAIIELDDRQIAQLSGVNASTLTQTNFTTL